MCLCLLLAQRTSFSGHPYYCLIGLRLTIYVVGPYSGWSKKNFLIANSANEFCVRTDSLSVDWLELSNSGLIDLVKTSPVMKSTEVTETKELSKTPTFLSVCACVCAHAALGFFPSFRAKKKSLPR